MGQEDQCVGGEVNGIFSRPFTVILAECGEEQASLMRDVVISLQDSSRKSLLPGFRLGRSQSTAQMSFRQSH